MQSIQLKTHIGSDGILQVQMPTEIRDTDIEVTIVYQSLSQNSSQPRYNAWGKLVTRQSIQDTIAGMRQLRQEISIDQQSIREMIEEGRRF
ncbi:MAG: hypothetical protein WAN66_01115 [Limnoraphis robusta]